MTAKKEVPQHLPIFVYGTLLPGHRNYKRYFEKRTPYSSQHATLAHHVLFGTSRSGFPYLIQNQDLPDYLSGHIVTRQGVTGVLLRFVTDNWAETIASLDYLEGVDRNHYARKKVFTDQGDEAWVYYAPRSLAQELLEFPLIRSGSWDQFVTEQANATAGS